jgi:hypothetical protein
MMPARTAGGTVTHRSMTKAKLGSSTRRRVAPWVAPWGLVGAQRGSSWHEAGSRSVGPSLSQVVVRGGFWQEVSLSVMSSGGGTRTPDTRIMIPGEDCHKPSEHSALGESDDDCTARAQQTEVESVIPILADPGLSLIVRHWLSLHSADRAGSVAMVKASGRDPLVGP